MRSIAALALVLCVLFQPTSVQAQENNPLIQSDSLLTWANSLSSAKQYKAAIGLAQQIDRNDSNYCRALACIANAYYFTKDYEHSAQVAERALRVSAQFPGQEPEILRIVALNLDARGNLEQARALFDSAIRKYPLDSALYNYDAYILTKANHPKEAEELIERYLLINPYNADAHFRLAGALAKQGNIVPAIFGFTCYLLLDPDGEFAENALEALNAIAQNADSLDEVKQRKEVPSKMYRELEQFLASKAAFVPDLKLASEVDDYAPRMIQVLFAKMRYHPEEPDFCNQFYVPLFRQVVERKQLASFLNRMLSGSTNSIIVKYIHDHQPGIDSVVGQMDDYFDRIQKTRELNYVNRSGATEARYFERGQLVGRGKIGDNQPTGPFRRLTSVGLPAYSGTYGEKHLKQGEWIFYNRDGTPQGRIRFKDDLKDGTMVEYYPTGAIKDSVFFRNDLPSGVYDVFYEDGNPSVKGQFANGQADGRFMQFYRSGPRAGMLTYQAGAQEGEVIHWFASGNVKDSGAMKNGKGDGLYRGYFESGGVQVEGNMNLGIEDGKWNTYYEDGHPNTVENHVLGNLDGPSQMFARNGRVIHTITYRRGKKTGDDTYSDEDDGKPFLVYTYDDGVLMSARAIDKSGKTISESKPAGDSMVVEVHAPAGYKTQVITYDLNGNMKGQKTTYYPTGAIHEVGRYLGNVPDGPVTEYYPDGRIARVTTYSLGMMNGYFKNYYHNGKISSEGWYVNNAHQGYWLSYDPEGTITDSIYFRNDLRSGYCSDISPKGKNLEHYYNDDNIEELLQYDTTGALIRDTHFPQGNGMYRLLFPGGGTRVEVPLKHGHFDGMRLAQYPDGKPLDREYYRYGFMDSVSQSYYPSGQLSSEKWYQMGRKTGTWKIFDEKNRLRRSTEYKNDKRNGMDRVYDENGKAETEKSYVDDQQNGLEKRYDPDGNLLIQVDFKDGYPISYCYPDKNGKLVADIPVMAQTGKIRSLFPDGTVSVEMDFQDGNLNGVVEVNYRNGKPRSIGRWVWNALEGLQEEFYANGQRKSETSYTANLQVGPYKKYNEKGVCTEEGSYHNGLSHGTTKKYNDDGVLMETDIYYDGAMLAVKKPG